MYQAKLTQEGQAFINIIIPRRELIINKEDPSSKLGEGGFGIVYKGKRGYVDVAIKEFKLFGEIPANIIDEFKKEALIMLQLGSQCHNLVQLYGVCYDQPYSLVMELFNQGNLYNLLKRTSTLNWEQKEKIATDIAVGLNFLHRHQIIHRDIKSMNVLIKDDLTAKISDYGLAKLKHHTMSSTAAKSAVGIMPWMAPELFKKKPSYSEASDVYSYGLVLWEMATHKVPYSDCENPGILINEILNGEPEEFPEATPPTFAKLINECRRKNPPERPTTSKIIEDLRNPQHMLLFSNSSVTAESSAPLIPPPPADPVVIPFEFKANPPSPRTQREMKKFLHHVGFGEQDEAESMLKSNPRLAEIQGDLTDCSDRTWRKITGFQYAVLALDYHMWTMLLKYLEDTQIRAQLEELYNNAALTADGWIIKSAWENKWPAVGWTKLIEVLDIYVKNYDRWTYDQRETHWCQQIGGAQLILPAHVINEYSHPSRPFYPCPKWGNNEASLPRQGVSDWRIADNGKYNLGKDFAWWSRGGERDFCGGGACAADTCTARVRGGYAFCLVQGRHWMPEDRAALSELLRARTEQARILLETKLQTKPSSTLRLAM